MFELGDEVIYMPTIDPLPPYNERPWDIGTVTGIQNGYVTVNFSKIEYVSHFLPFGLVHHPLGSKAHRLRFTHVLPEIIGAVEGRVAALVLSEKTGLTACRGFGPADNIRTFLDPRKPRKHVNSIQTQETEY